MTFQELFRLSMKRELPELLVGPKGPVLNIGSSEDDTWVIPGAIPLGLPDWCFPFPHNKIPMPDNSVSAIHCYHFMEHLYGKQAIAFLREVERVLQPGGTFNFCVPYYSSHLQAQCLDHKSFWNEETFENLFSNRGYNIAGDWQLKVHFQIIAAIVHRNLALIGQLTK